MALSDDVYDPNGTSNDALFNLVQGGFAFVAGKVAIPDILTFIFG